MYISVGSNLLYFLSTILLSGVIPARLPRQIIIIGSHPGTSTSSDFYYYRESPRHVYLLRLLLLSVVIPARLPRQIIIIGSNSGMSTATAHFIGSDPHSIQLRFNDGGSDPHSIRHVYRNSTFYWE